MTSASCAAGRSRHQTLSRAALLTPTESPARASASPRLSAHGRSQHGISEESVASGGQSRRPARGGASDSWAQDPVGTRLWTGQQAALGTERAQWERGASQGGELQGDAEGCPLFQHS